MGPVPAALSSVQIALLLLIAGAVLTYVEFLRPGWILPGVIGVTLMIVGLLRLAQCDVRWPGVALAATASLCYAIAARTGSPLPFIFAGSGCLLAAVTLVDCRIGFSLGLPFAVLTGYLVNTAIRARRNKSS